MIHSDPSSLEIGWSPPLTSTMARRLIPKPTPTSTWKPSLSGPLWMMALVISSSMACSGVRSSEYEIPQIPHIQAILPFPIKSRIALQCFPNYSFLPRDGGTPVPFPGAEHHQLVICELLRQGHPHLQMGLGYLFRHPLPVLHCPRYKSQ